MELLAYHVTPHTPDVHAVIRSAGMHQPDGFLPAFLMRLADTKIQPANILQLGEVTTSHAVKTTHLILELVNSKLVCN